MSKRNRAVGPDHHDEAHGRQPIAANRANALVRILDILEQIAFVEIPLDARQIRIDADTMVGKQQ